MPEASKKIDLATLVDTILTTLDDDKAQDVLTIDLTGKTSIADRMIIASGTSARAVAAMSEHIVTKLKALHLKPGSEGQRYGDWVVIDAGDVIVHLFRPEVRLFYDLEHLWSAPAATTTPTKKPSRRA